MAVAPEVNMAVAKAKEMRNKRRCNSFPTFCCTHCSASWISSNARLPLTPRGSSALSSFKACTQKTHTRIVHAMQATGGRDSHESERRKVGLLGLALPATAAANTQVHVHPRTKKPKAPSR
jgi:hypothetical protein